MEASISVREEAVGVPGAEEVPVAADSPAAEADQGVGDHREDGR